MTFLFRFAGGVSLPRSRGFSQVRRASRRRTGWEEGPGTQTPSTLTASVGVILGNGQASTEDGLTVVRIRGMIELVLTQAAAALDGLAVCFSEGVDHGSLTSMREPPLIVILAVPTSTASTAR